VSSAERAARTLAAGCLLGLLACPSRPSAPSPGEPAQSASASEAPLALAHRFENDPAFRRRCLEDSLVNRDNGYAKARLTHYTPEDWGRLPIATFRSRPVVPADLGRPVPRPDGSWAAVPRGPTPESEASLQRRGEAMFRRFPAQVERSMIPVLQDRDGPARYGLWQTSESVGGLVWVALPGGVFPALTCSSCHASLDRRGRWRAGVPNHRIDLGRAKDDYLHARTLYSSWGPGRVDVAADARDNPIVIADLRAVRFESHLHRTANVRNSLGGLAVRVETGLIQAHRGAVRPAPGDAFALAFYLWHLGDGFDLGAPLHHPGRQLFERHCAGCHRGPGHAGPPVPAERIGSPVAEQPSSVRGTGEVQSTSLLGLSDRERLLFGGDARGIGEFLDPDRTAGGHYVGRELDPAERRALVDYLNAL
jgi:mono/diheme cytochrome c family protein